MHTYFHIVRYHFFFSWWEVVRHVKWTMLDAIPSFASWNVLNLAFLKRFTCIDSYTKAIDSVNTWAMMSLQPHSHSTFFFLRFVSFGLLTFYIAPLVPPLILSRFEQFAERAINSVEPSPIHIFPQHSKVNKLSFLLAFLTTLRQRERKKKLISELKEVLWWSTSYSLDIMLCEFIPVTVRIKVGLQIQLSMWIYESSY